MEPTRRFYAGQEIPPRPVEESRPVVVGADDPDREGPNDYDPPVIYAPSSTGNHQTATITIDGATGSLGVQLAPGVAYTALYGDRHSSPEVVFVPTSTTADGYPAGMVPVVVDDLLVVS
jgi:hypothetical protein